jgi:hypothetical protein
MQEQIWIDLLRRIPTVFHEGLMIATVTGADVMVQAIVRLEDHYLILRGRPAGTSETGRTLVLPYCQINYLYFPPRLNPHYAAALFGAEETSFAALPAGIVLPTGSVEETPEPAPPEQQPEDKELTTAAPPETKPPQPQPTAPEHSKSVLLARLRAKLNKTAT